MANSRFLLLAAAAGLVCLASASPAPAPSNDPADELLERVLKKSQRKLESSAVVLTDHSTWATGWDIETRDYSIHTPLNWYVGARLGADLEASLAEFRRILRTDWRPPARMRVFLYPTMADYNAFANDVGGFHSGVLGSFWATDHPERPVALYHPGNATLVRMWATHSTLHQFIEQAFPSIPPLWMGEGLAGYFGVFQWDWNWGASEYDRLVEAGYFVPLRRLFDEPIDVYAGDPENLDTDVAHGRLIQLAGMFAYLLHYREDTLTQTNADGIVLLSPAEDYINDRLRGMDVSDHPVHELFTVRLEQLEADLRAFRFGQ